MRHGPVFENQLATLDLDGPRVRLRLESIPPGERGLRCIADTQLVASP